MVRNAIKKKLCIDLKWRESHTCEYKRNCCNLSGVPLRTDWTTVHLKCLGSIRYPLYEYKTSTKILTDCRHYPGASKWPACKPFGNLFSMENTHILVKISYFGGNAFMV